MPDYSILLPPSEGKQPGGSGGRTWPEIASQPKNNTFFELNSRRDELIEGLQAALTAPEAELSKLFHVKGTALADALNVNHAVREAPLLPAIERYTGVLFDHLDYDGMSSDARTQFTTHAILFSGLWGLLSATDLIPNYRLKIDAKLPAIGSVAAFWKPHISALLNPRLAGRVVWDFLPGAHRRAWDGKAAFAARWQVKFLQRTVRNGGESLKTVTHWSKALKGALVRHICEERVCDAQSLGAFNHPEGYVLALDRSKVGPRGGELIFIKEAT